MNEVITRKRELTYFGRLIVKTARKFDVFDLDLNDRVDIGLLRVYRIRDPMIIKPYDAIFSVTPNGIFVSYYEFFYKYNAESFYGFKKNL